MCIAWIRSNACSGAHLHFQHTQICQQWLYNNQALLYIKYNHPKPDNAKKHAFLLNLLAFIYIK